ncbi:TIGR04197 family type VII secretion effector [Streptococcus pluranimalium]|uniref:TIGR04197 family type VII secretion effector n=1 Tax=Streptococcus pluranimalium TaxID=82348 RepID=UPI0039FBADE4
MFGIIALSETVFQPHISQLKSTQGSLVNVSAKFYEYTSTSSALDLYRDQFNELSVLITAYANFLNNDIDLMNQSGLSLLAMDAQLGGQFGKTTP